MSFFGSARKGAKEAAAYMARGNARLQKEYEKAENLARENIDSYLPYEDMAANALGLNGVEGGEEASGAYEAGSSYSLLQDVLKEATRRWGNAQSAAGSLKSGRALEELGRRTSDIALNDYSQNWLRPILDRSTGAATARSNLGNLHIQRGKSFNDYISNVGTMMGNAKAAGSPYASLIGPLIGSAFNVATGGTGGFLSAALSGGGGNTFGSSWTPMTTNQHGAIV